MDAILTALTGFAPMLLGTILPGLGIGGAGLGIAIAVLKFGLGYDVSQSRKALVAYGGSFAALFAQRLVTYPVGVYPPLQEMVWLAIAALAALAVGGTTFQVPNQGGYVSPKK
jgi:hypothetical protein